MSTEDKHYGWQDGLPTGPDVTEIRKKWPELKPGDRIEYQDVADLLGIEIGSNRWRSVTNAWRDREEEFGRVIKCENNRAFYVCQPEQITASTFSTLKHIGRSAKKQRQHLSTIRSADDLQKGIVDHQARLMLAVEKDARSKRMNILPGSKPTETPRIEPPKSKEATA